jgi:hypothetical protein
MWSIDLAISVGNAFTYAVIAIIIFGYVGEYFGISKSEYKIVFLTMFTTMLCYHLYNELEMKITMNKLVTIMNNKFIKKVNI